MVSFLTVRIHRDCRELQSELPKGSFTSTTDIEAPHACQTCGLQKACVWRRGELDGGNAARFDGKELLVHFSQGPGKREADGLRNQFVEGRFKAASRPAER